MKALGIIAIIVGILVLLVVWAMTLWNKIIFTLGFKGVDFSTIDLSSLAGLGQTDTKLLLNVNIKNGNGFSIPFSGMQVFLYYDNTLIAQTSGALSFMNFKLLGNSSKILNQDTGDILDGITDYVNVHLNSASINLIKDVLSKKNPKVNYIVKVTVFGIPITYSDYFLATV